MATTRARVEDVMDAYGTFTQETFDEWFVSVSDPDPEQAKQFKQLMSLCSARGNYDNQPHPGWANHHICPSCVGGSNQLNNLVKVTESVHNQCHVLLATIFPEEKKLVYCANRMMGRNGLNDDDEVSEEMKELADKAKAKQRANHSARMRNNQYAKVRVKLLPPLPS